MVEMVDLPATIAAVAAIVAIICVLAAVTHIRLLWWVIAAAMRLLRRARGKRASDSRTVHEKRYLAAFRHRPAVRKTNFSETISAGTV